MLSGPMPPSNVRGFRLSRPQPSDIVRGPRRPFCRPLAFFFLVRQEGEGEEKRTGDAPQAEREAAARLHETGHSQPAAPWLTVRRRAATQRRWVLPSSRDNNSIRNTAAENGQR